MKEPNTRSPYAPPAPEPEPPSSLDQVFARAAQAIERDRAESAKRGPLARALYAATAIVAVVAAAVLTYGAFTYYDAPIRETPNGFVSKHGTSYSREHYESYLLWTKGVWTAFAVTFVTAFAASLADKRGH
jgi:ABC-type Fe3+ transport system permease subunit